MQPRTSTGQHSETQTTKIREALEIVNSMFELLEIVKVLILSDPYYCKNI
jgi:hypothetical protein